MFSIRSIVILLVAGFAPALQAAEAVHFRLESPKGKVDISFDQHSQAADDAEFNKPAKGDPKLTKRQDQIATEDAIYPGCGYKLLDDNAEVNGFRLGKNQPNHVQICGGLALARLLGGPYSVPTDEAWKVVNTLGARVRGMPEIGDVAVWRTNDGVVHHFGLVAKTEDGTSFPVWVYSKDNDERVYIGPANTFPPKKDYGEVTYYHLDWSSIKVTRIYTWVRKDAVISSGGKDGRMPKFLQLKGTTSFSYDTQRDGKKWHNTMSWSEPPKELETEETVKLTLDASAEQGWANVGGWWNIDCQRDGKGESSAGSDKNYRAGNPRKGEYTFVFNPGSGKAMIQVSAGHDPGADTWVLVTYTYEKKTK